MRNVREMMLVLDGKVSSGLRSATTETAKRLRDVETRISEIGQKKSAVLALERQMRKAGLSTDGLAQDTLRLNTELGRASNKAVVLRDKLRQLQAQEAKAQQWRDRISKNQTATANARGSMIEAAGLAMSLAVPVQQAMKFEDAMADVRKVVDGLDDPKQFKAMGDAIMRLNTRDGIPMAADGLAQIVAYGGQAGLQRKELIAFARDAAKMGVAFDQTAEEAGESMSRWRKSFDLNQSAVVKLADKINYLGNTSGAKAALISQVVTNIGPLGKIGGLASGEIAALSASMVALGVEPERAATGIKKIITTLNSGSAATKQQSDAFKMLGLDAVTLSKRMQKNAGGAILDVFNRIKSLEKHKQTAILKELFGEEGLAAVGSQLGALGKLQLNLARVADKRKYANSVEKEFAVRSQTTSNQLIILQNWMSLMAVKVGSVFLPEIVKLTKSITPIINGFVRWSEKHPALFSGIVKVAGALVGMRIAMMAGNYASSVVKGGVLQFGSALWKLGLRLNVGAAALWAWNAAQNAGKIGMIAFRAATLAFSATPLVVQIMLIVAAVAVIIRTIKEAIGWWNALQDKKKSDQSVKETVAGAKDYLAHRKGSIRKWQIESAERARRGLAPLPKPKLYARGGIVNSPQLGWVGEAGSEAIIPLNNHRDRAADLWRNTGKALGLSAEGINVTFAPVINISGSASKSDVSAALSRSKDDLRRMLQELLRDERRRSVV